MLSLFQYHRQIDWLTCLTVEMGRGKFWLALVSFTLKITPMVPTIMVAPRLEHPILQDCTKCTNFQCSTKLSLLLWYVLGVGQHIVCVKDTKVEGGCSLVPLNVPDHHGPHTSPSARCFHLSLQA